MALLEANNRLSALIDRVLAGEEFGITRRGKVVARLAPPEGDDAASRAAVASLHASRKGVSLGRLRCTSSVILR